MKLKLTFTAIDGQSEVTHTRSLDFSKDTAASEIYALLWQGLHALGKDSTGIAAELNDVGIPPLKTLDKSVDELDLSIRSSNCLMNGNIRYIGELVQRTEADMLKIKNFSRRSLKEIKGALAERHLSLGMELGCCWAPPAE